MTRREETQGRWAIPEDIAVETDPDDRSAVGVLRASRGVIVRLPQVGLLVWRASPRVSDTEGLVALLAAEHGWPSDEIAQPVQNFVMSLVDHGLLEERSGHESN